MGAMRSGNAEGVAESSEMMDRKQTATAFGWYVLFAAINRVIVPLGMVIFNRVLGPTTMGVYGLIAAILAMADLFRDGGLSQTYIADQELTEDRERAYHSLAVGIGAALGVFVLVLGFWKGDQLNLPPEQRWSLWWICAVLIANGFLTIPAAKLQREAKFKEVGMAEMGASRVSLWIAAGWVFRGWGLVGLVWMVIISAALNWLLVVRVSGQIRLGGTRSLFGSIIRRSSSVLGSLVVSAPYGFADKLFISSRLGLTQLGFFNGAWNIGMKPGELISGPLTKVLYVAYSKRLGDEREFASAYVRSVSMVCLLVLPVYAVIGVFSGSIIEALMGSEWARSAWILTLLTPYYAARAVGSLGSVALTAGGRASAISYSWIAAYLVAAGMIWMRSANLDVEWVALSLTGGAVTVYALNTFMAMERYRPAGAEAKNLVISLLLGLSSIGLCLILHSLKLGVALELVAGFLVVPVLYLVLVGLAHHRKPHVYLSLGGLKRLYRGL